MRSGSYSECEQSRKIIKVSGATSDPIHKIATFQTINFFGGHCVKGAVLWRQLCITGQN